MKTDVLKIGDKAIVKKKVRKDESEYTTQIQNINGDEIRILTPMYKSALIRLQDQTRIELLVFSSGKVYELDAVVKGTVVEDNLYYTDIVVTSEIRKIERRYYFRVKTMDDILVREKNEKDSQEYVAGITIDISGGGLLFSSTHDFSQNIIVEMKVNIDYRQVILEGEILSKTKQEGLGSYKYTVKFLNLDNSVQEMIIRYVFKLEREKLTKEIRTN